MNSFSSLNDCIALNDPGYFDESYFTTMDSQLQLPELKRKFLEDFGNDVEVENDLEKEKEKNDEKIPFGKIPSFKIQKKKNCVDLTTNITNELKKKSNLNY